MCVGSFITGSMQLPWVVVCTLWGVGEVGGQRRELLQDIIQRIKSSPRHQSSSPSWFGERQFEVIGTGRLPLQSHNIDTDSQVVERHFVEDNFDSFFTTSDRRISDEIPAYSPDTNHQIEYLSLPGQDREYYQVSQPSRYHRGAYQDTTYQDQDTFQGNFQNLRRKPNRDTYFQSSGLEWDSVKSRNKRSPFKRIKIKVNNPFYFSNPSYPKRKQKAGRRQEEQVLKIERFDAGPQGFWDDANFDTNFFDRGHFDPPETDLGYGVPEEHNHHHDYNMEAKPGYHPVHDTGDRYRYPNNLDRSQSVSLHKVGWICCPGFLFQGGGGEGQLSAPLL